MTLAAAPFFSHLRNKSECGMDINRALFVCYCDLWACTCRALLEYEINIEKLLSPDLRIN